MELRSSAMSADPTTDAMSVTKNRMAPFEAGTKKKLRSRAWPGKKAPKKRTKTMELTRTKPTPTAVATIVAGRLNSRRNPDDDRTKPMSTAEERHLSPSVRRE